MYLAKPCWLSWDLSAYKPAGHSWEDSGGEANWAQLHPAGAAVNAEHGLIEGLLAKAQKRNDPPL